MKKYYITSNVNDRSATAKALANGEQFDVWFTPGVVRHYDEQGDLICTESAPMPEDVERINPCTETTVSVVFNFGSFVTMGVSIHEGLTFAENLALRSDDVDEYQDPESGKWVKQTVTREEALDKLTALRERVDASEIVESVAHKVEQTKPRSAWGKGVKAYAEELLEELAEAVEGGYIDEGDLANRRLFEKAMLNGAADWTQYSEGGCALCYDGQIAERLCAPWELRRTDHGRKDPNPKERWIDCQSRALYQAAHLVLSLAF